MIVAPPLDPAVNATDNVPSLGVIELIVGAAGVVVVLVGAAFTESVATPSPFAFTARN